MQTYRCHKCGQVLATFVTVAPGLALPFSQEAAVQQVEARRQQHTERCPARRAAVAN